MEDKKATPSGAGGLRIGIFGGTFDPIHNGHIALGHHFLSCLDLDEVWFMITPMNPWKREKELTPDEKRFQLVSAALADEPQLVASDYEFQLEKPSFSYKTLRRLREDFPQNEFILLMGADNWVKFGNWAYHDEILQYHKIAVYPRNGCPIAGNTLPKNVVLLPQQLYNVSSTEVRDLLAEGRDVSHLVPKAVCDML